MYDFDKVIERRNTGSMKWDTLSKDLLPLWVADMDFQSPPEVIETLQKRAEHGIYGYPGSYDSCFQSIKDWMAKRFSWQIKQEWLTFSPGTITALSMLIKIFTYPGDKVILQSPGYPPFINTVQNNGCHVVYNQLLLEENRYRMDFADLEQKLKEPRVKMLILCSPHNPVGRVWEREELARLCELCQSNNVLIISDELHADLVYKDYQHIPLPMISQEICQNTIVLSGPTKTFNLPGLQTSFSIIPNPHLRARFITAMESIGYKRPNIFGLDATQAAYDHGGPWLDALLTYIQRNLNYLTEFLNNKIPSLKVIPPQGTYLAWVDCRELALKPQELEDFCIKKARIFVNQGHVFGPGGAGFIRINMACPRSILAEALQRIEKCI